MATRKGIIVFGTYVVDHKLYQVCLFIYVLYIIKIERSDRSPTAVSSN